MRDAESFDFNCPHCSHTVRATEDQAGTQFSYPQCNKVSVVPHIRLVRAPNGHGSPLKPVNPISRHFATLGRRETAASFSGLLTHLVGAYFFILLFSFAIGLTFDYGWIVAWLLIIASTAVTLHRVWELLRARQRVLIDKSVDLM